MSTVVLGYGGKAAGAAIGSFFGPIGTFIGGIVGAAVGGTAGAYVDQTYVFPKIFGKDKSDLQGPRLEDTQIMTASPGSPAHLHHGRQARVAGTVIWLSEIKKVKHEESVGGKSGGDVTTFENFISLAVSVGRGPISAIRKIWADGKVIYESLSSGELFDDRYTSLTFHMGTQDQPTDFVIDATLQLEGHPVGDTPAYRGTAYFVLEDLNLGDFGGRVPNITALVEGEEQTLVSEAVTQILTSRGRVPRDEFDTRWLRGEEVVGYPVTGLQPPVRALEPLFLAFDLVVQEELGVSVFRKRADTVPVDVPQEHLAAREYGEEAPRRITVHDSPGTDLPEAIDVKYVDPAFYWQPNSQRARRFNAPAPGDNSIDFPLTMSGSSAKSIAQRLLWSSWAERLPVDLTLPPSWVHVLESDLLDLTVDGWGFTVRLSKVNRGRNGVIEVSGVTEEAQALDQSAVVDVPDVPAEAPPQTQPEVVFRAMELPLLRNTQVSGEEYTRSLHFAAALRSPGAQWKGARVYSSRVSTGPFADNVFAEVSVEAAMGFLLTAPSATPPFDAIDEVDTFDVEMFEGSLSSLTFEDVAEGRNWVAVQTGVDSQYEIIGFITATLIAPRQYRLSRLLRGLQDTWDNATHASNNTCVLLSPESGSTTSGVRQRHYDANNHNKSDFYYRAVSRGGTLGGALTQGPYLRNSRIMRPFGPAGVEGVRDASFNLTIVWVRRSAAQFAVLTLDGPVPMLEPTEEYDVELYRASDNVLVRTVRVKDATNYAYTAAAQTGDAITPGVGAVKVRVYQINRNLDAVGRGNPSMYGALVTM